MSLWHITAVSTKGVAAIYQIGKYQRLRNISSSLIAHSSCGARVLICQGRLTDASELTRNYVRGAAHYKFTLTRWHVENCGHIVIFIPSVACFMRTAASLFNIPFSQRVSVNRKKKKKSKIRISLLHDIIYFDINFEIEAVRFSRLASRTVGTTRKVEITNGRQKNFRRKKKRNVSDHPILRRRSRTYRLRKRLVYTRRNPLGWIMKRLFCRREAAVRDACSRSDDNGAAFEHYVPARALKVKRN